jgi:hypothetical protein
MDLSGINNFRKSAKGKVILYFIKLALSTFILWMIFRKIDLGSALKDVISCP